MPLEPRPLVQELFVFARDDYGNNEAAALYPRMALWAAHHRAARLIVGRHTDVALSTIRAKLGLEFRAIVGKWTSLDGVL
jgi:hypothetical protein